MRRRQVQCGAQGPWYNLNNDYHRVVCDLPAGHKGDHEGRISPFAEKRNSGAFTWAGDGRARWANGQYRKGPRS